MASAAGSAGKIIANYDLTIIGGGIIGLATARQVLLKHPKLKVCVLEKDGELATHQSKRNSGVVHAGIYYKKGSLKSRFCIRGAQMVEQYCKDKGVKYERCGKMIVATREEELKTMYNLFENAKANNIRGIELIGPGQVRALQPGCNRAIEAIWSPNTAIVDWREVALSYAQDFQALGGAIHPNVFVKNITASEDGRSLFVTNLYDDTQIETKSIVNASGMLSDILAKITGNREHPMNVPFSGSYYLLSDRLAKTIKTNVYPVPDPNLPFLGVHITPRVDGSVLIGPTSLLTLGYYRYTDDDLISLAHLHRIYWKSGLLKMLRKKQNFLAGIKEIRRYLFKQSIVWDVRPFIPDIKSEDLIDINFCGIRAQAIEKDGRLVDDFIFETGRKPEFRKVLHIRNCPSPAATSSLAIAERVLNIMEDSII